jgi:hypothetical protein
MPSIINAPLSGGVTITSDTSGILQLQTASTTAMTINGSQNVGIGTASPAVKLDVVGVISNTAGVVFGGSDSSTATGKIQYLTNSGLSIQAKTGSGYDFTLFGAAGNNIMRIPTGTTNLDFPQAGVTFNAFGIGLGASIPSSGTGITFPATQSASSDANTLDDYEEGTWTPIDASGAGLSFTVFGTARYVKIGQLVFFCIDQLNYPSTANLSTASIGGLPFTNNANNTGGINPVANNSNMDAGLIVANATNMYFYPAGVTSASTNAGLSGANIYGISGCYQVP